MSKIHDILWLEETDSTNTYAKRHIEELDNLSVVTAMSQTQGRGQGDHTWSSESGKNILLSIVLKSPGLPARRQNEVSILAASSVMKLLKNHGIKSWMKPPNDIYVRDRKICGILIEHAIRGQRISWSIIGIGLNVNQKVFDEYIPNPTSMILEKNAPDNVGAYDIRKLTEQFVSIFEEGLYF